MPSNKQNPRSNKINNQFQAAHVGSILNLSISLETLTGQHPHPQTSFVKTIEELGEIATTQSSHRKLQKKLHNSVYNNLLGNNTEKADGQKRNEVGIEFDSLAFSSFVRFSIC